jgi:hypothetical protein
LHARRPDLPADQPIVRKMTPSIMRNSTANRVVLAVSAPHESRIPCAIRSLETVPNTGDEWRRSLTFDN